MDYELIKMALSEIRLGMKKVSTRNIAVSPIENDYRCIEIKNKVGEVAICG